MSPFIFIASLLCCGAGASIATAQSTVAHTFTDSSVFVPSSNSLQVPLFDSGLGALRQVRVTIGGNVSGTLYLENLTANTALAPPFDVGADIDTVVTSGPANPAYEFAPRFHPIFVPPFDGLLDYAGPSSLTPTFHMETGTGQPSMTAIQSSDCQLAN